MSCRIDRHVIEENLVILRISGRITGQDVDMLRALLKHETLTREQVVNLLYENQPPCDDIDTVRSEAA